MEEKEKSMIPPYISYKTFLNFLNNLKVGIPSRIDRSVMSSLSGSAQSQLSGTLKYLHLISENGLPSETLSRLVNSEGAERQKILREILKKSYSFLFQEGVNLDRITLNQMQELFNQVGASGGTTQKCIAFFISTAKEAGFNISPHIKVKSRAGRPKGRRSISTEKQNDYTPESEKEIKPPIGIGWQQLLLSKFPSLDPAWPDDVKSKWFDAFKELMELKKKSEEK